jgi:hypothetical protein
MLGCGAPRQHTPLIPTLQRGIFSITPLFRLLNQHLLVNRETLLPVVLALDAYDRLPYAAPASFLDDQRCEPASSDACRIESFGVSLEL